MTSGTCVPSSARAPESIVLALAGDAMLGRAVAERFTEGRQPELFSVELRAAIREADLFVLNLECCISSRSAKRDSPGKRYYFRAPPAAADLLAGLGADCVTLANNHALDFGSEALLDTIEHLHAAGIRCVGAGTDVAAARAPVVLDARGFRLGIVAATDHPAECAALADRAGVAFADLADGAVPPWVYQSIAVAHAQADAVLFSPHWGPNLTSRPPVHVLAAAAEIGPGVTLVAGHSAHVFHGVGGNVLYDLGDLIDDYTSAQPPRTLLAGLADKFRKESAKFGAEIRGVAGDRQLLWHSQRQRAVRIAQMIRARRLRPDLGMLFFVTLDRSGPRRLEAVPTKLSRCHTGFASGGEAAIAQRRFRRACETFGTQVTEKNGRSIIEWPVEA